MTVDWDWIRCDSLGCDTTAFYDATSTVAKGPEVIRRWFGMDGWNSRPGDGGSEGRLDFCPAHRIWVI